MSGSALSRMTAIASDERRYARVETETGSLGYDRSVIDYTLQRLLSPLHIPGVGEGWVRVFSNNGFPQSPSPPTPLPPPEIEGEGSKR